MTRTQWFPLLPGWLLLAALAVIAGILEGQVEFGGKHPLEAPVIAILLGILLRNTIGLPARVVSGVKAFEKPLIVGIVLIGAKLDLSLLTSHGENLILIILLTMVTGLASIVVVGRVLKLSGALSVLLAVGTTICGGTAIAVTAPLIRAREEETSYAIATIALCGLAAILVYPALGRFLGIGDFHFGAFVGTAIHSTPQVVGAGFIYSDKAGEVATAVKLVRNCFLAPAAFMVALWFAGVSDPATGEAPSLRGRFSQIAKGFPWFLFGFFVMAGLGSAGYFTPKGASGFSDAGKFLILLGMAGIGLNTQFAALRSIGFRPFIVGVVGTLVVAAVSAGLIFWLL
ncbi:MAG: putative sulfate exporter family transporter [Bdellovibrionales bacterium]|nr:putative sulfate exporter family transporter [Bdellovibrionales bacterium]